MTLKHKVAVVTGGSDGIGRQIVLKLATQGVHVAILGRNTERLTAVEKEANEAGSPKAKLYVCDLRSLSMIKEVVGRILHEFGGVDVLINNAGMASMNHPTLQDTLLLGGALGFGFLGILILFPLVFMASSPENKE